MTSSREPNQIIPRTFPGISLDEVEELVAFSQINSYPADTIICHEGELEEIFYLILEGEVQVSKVINNLEVRLLKTLTVGDFFGEMALIHNVPSAASVKAVTNLVVLEINKEAFNRILKHSSSVSIALVQEISRRLRENDEMAIDDLRLRAGELADAYQKLAEEEVMRRDLLSNIVRLLRTPLVTAGGYLQVINKGNVPPKQLKSILETVNRNVQQISSLVNDILFVQEMDLILEKFQPVDMTGVAYTVAGRYQEKANERRIELRVKPDTGLPPVSGDPKNLERALTALVDNAIKFSPEGGKVDLRLRRKEDTLAIAVSDKGAGIQPEAIPHVFDRFHLTAKGGYQSFEGMGMGLALTKQVVEQHRGKLEVKSTPGKGSTFTMFLNIWDENGSGKERDNHSVPAS
jgi:signal transduction histidine kinase